mmetsp:Transcript_4830/g.8618  ORF Transcript_4830/g.8618 Transcript_4830/m.8618 type:complete len:376 (+) Transcript_4830:243-1370(+)
MEQAATSSDRMDQTVLSDLKLKPAAQSLGEDKCRRRRLGQDNSGCRLEFGLRRMREALAALPRASRLEAIERLSWELRQTLLRHMEEEYAMGIAPRGLHQDREASPTKVARPPRRCSRAGRGSRLDASGAGICAVRLAGGGVRYFARLTLGGIAINSRTTGSRQAAQRLRGILVSGLATDTSKTEGSLDIGDWLLQVFGSSNRLRADAVRHLQSESWTFRALVDARAWVGQILSSRTVNSVEEAVALRRQLEAARLCGWEALRLAFTGCLPRRALRGSKGTGGSGRLAALDARRAEKQKWQGVRAAERAIAKSARKKKRIEDSLERLAKQLEKVMRRKLKLKGSRSARLGAGDSRPRKQETTGTVEQLQMERRQT